VALVTCISKAGENHECHEQDAHDGAAREHPAESFDFGFAVAVEEDGDFVVEFLDLWGGLALVWEGWAVGSK
jgi:hypothetical protein